MEIVERDNVLRMLQRATCGEGAGANSGWRCEASTPAGVVVEATACSPRTDRPWFDITILNVHDKNGYPACTATAYDNSGQALFDWGIPISSVGPVPAGPPVSRGTRLHLIWYFDNPAGDYVKRASWRPTTITRYKATCHGRSSSEVPN